MMIGLVLQAEQAKTQIAPLEIFCVIEKNYQKFSIAEDACQNIFTSAGARLKLDSIDWTKIRYQPMKNGISNGQNSISGWI